MHVLLAREPVAYLWASEDTIYGRFGFGLASFRAEIDLPSERSEFHARFAASGIVRLAPLETIPEIHCSEISTTTPTKQSLKPPTWRRYLPRSTDFTSSGVKRDTRRIAKGEKP